MAINAKDELLSHIKEHHVEYDVEYVKIVYCPYYGEDKLLIEGTLSEVLLELDFEYDEGYGSQELFGFIWYNGCTWSERSEYDGSECWQYKKRPDLSIDVLAISDL